MELCVVVNFSKPRTRGLSSPAQTVLSPIVERHLCHHITVHFGTDFGCDFRFIKLVSENPRILSYTRLLSGRRSGHPVASGRVFPNARHVSRIGVHHTHLAKTGMVLA